MASQSFDAVAFLGGLFEPMESSLAARRPEAPAAAQAEAAPKRFRPFAFNAAGAVRYLDDTETAAWLADCQRQPEGDRTAETFGDSPDALWEAAEEPGDGCPRCGSLAAWWSIIGTRRCLNCEPPRRPDAEAIRTKAARIRQQTAKRRDCSPAFRADTLQRQVKRS